METDIVRVAILNGRRGSQSRSLLSRIGTFVEAISHSRAQGVVCLAAPRIQTDCSHSLRGTPAAQFLPITQVQGAKLGPFLYAPQKVPCELAHLKCESGATDAGDSLESRSAFLGKLLGVKSFESAVQLQSEFATASYADFVRKRKRSPIYAPTLLGKCSSSSRIPFAALTIDDCRFGRVLVSRSRARHRAQFSALFTSSPARHRHYHCQRNIERVPVTRCVGPYRLSLRHCSIGRAR